ncbi:MAG TPA: hypothetical protein VJX30_01490 [Terriglobales bacterium]|jgi:hypothetical protein|nr:hypothetical protein [Terriglobales bacterium]
MKQFLIYVLKNAVNASLAAIVPIWKNYSTYNLSTLHGWLNVGAILGGAVLAREAVILYPQLLKWSQTNAQ